MLDHVMPDTLALLERDKGSWRETAAAAGVTYDWLRKLAAGQIAEPGFYKIQRLHVHLSEKYAA